MHQKLSRTYAMPINLDENSSSPFAQDLSRDDENASEDSPEEVLYQPPGSDVVKFNTNFYFILSHCSQGGVLFLLCYLHCFVNST